MMLDFKLFLQFFTLCSLSFFLYNDVHYNPKISVCKLSVKNYCQLYAFDLVLCWNKFVYSWRVCCQCNCISMQVKLLRVVTLNKSTNLLLSSVSGSMYMYMHSPICIYFLTYPKSKILASYFVNIFIRRFNSLREAKTC